MRKDILIISIMLATLFGCKKKEQVEVNYYQTYTLDYNKSRKKLIGEAFFTLAGTSTGRIMLGNGSSVKLNGIDPIYSSDGISYHWSATGLADNSVFILSKKSGINITNTISKTEIGDIDFDVLPDTISKSAGFEFTWKGSDLRQNENITISLLDEAKQIIKYSNNTVFTKEDIKNTIPGKATISIGRSRTIDLKENDNNAGGKISVGISVEREITIVE